MVFLVAQDLAEGVSQAGEVLLGSRHTKECSDVVERIEVTLVRYSAHRSKYPPGAALFEHPSSDWRIQGLAGQ